MVDVFTKEKRSEVMSKIRGKWTVPEKIIHNRLKAGKIRHRMHPRMEGNPDVLLKDTDVVVFIDGDFWHGKDFKKRKHKLSAYWRNKITTNMKRDRKHSRMLRDDGWEVVRLWEEDIRKRPEWCMERIKA